MPTSQVSSLSSDVKPHTAVPFTATDSNSEEPSHGDQRRSSYYQRRHSLALHRTKKGSFNEQDEIDQENGFNVCETPSNHNNNLSSENKSNSSHVIHAYENPFCTDTNSVDNEVYPDRRTFCRNASEDPAVRSPDSFNNSTGCESDLQRYSGPINTPPRNIFPELRPTFSPSTPDLVAKYNNYSGSVVSKKLSSNSFSSYGGRRHSTYAMMYHQPTSSEVGHDAGMSSSYHGGPSASSYSPNMSNVARNESKKPLPLCYIRQHRESTTIGEIASSVVVSLVLLFNSNL